MGRFTIFTEFNKDEDEEKRIKPSQIAREEQKKKRFSIFTEFNEIKKPEERKVEPPKPEPPSEKPKTFIEKAKGFFTGLFEKKEEEQPKKRSRALDFITGVAGGGVSLPDKDREDRLVGDIVAGGLRTISNLVDYTTRLIEGIEQAEKSKTSDFLTGVLSGGIMLPEHTKEDRAKIESLNLLTEKKISKKTREVSKKIQRWSEEMSPENPDFVDQLAQGVGSMGAFVAVSLVTGGSAIAPVVIESIGEAGSVYETNREAGLSVEESGKKANTTLALNLILNSTLNVFNIDVEDGKILAKALKGVKFEGLQEGSQQIISNASTGRPLLEGVFESIGVGAVIGGGAAVVLPTGSGGKDKEYAQKEETSDFVPVEVEPIKEVTEVVEEKKEALEPLTEEEIKIKAEKKVEEVIIPKELREDIKDPKNIVESDFAPGNKAVLTDLDISIIEAGEPTRAFAIEREVGRPIEEPIEVVYDAVDKEYRVMDGHNRLAQAIANKDKTIPAKVIIIGEEFINAEGLIDQVKPLNELGVQPTKEVKPKITEKKPIEVTPVSKELKPLAEEVKKFKTAEELFPKEFKPNDVKSFDVFGSSVEGGKFKDIDVAVFLDPKHPSFKKGEEFNRKVGNIEYHVFPDNEQGRAIFQAQLEEGVGTRVPIDSLTKFFEQVTEKKPIEVKREKKVVKKEKVAKPVKKKVRPTAKKGKGGIFDRTFEELKLTTNVEDNFDSITLRNQADKATSFMEKNPEDSIAISFRQKPPPKGIRFEAINIATSEQALANGDLQLFSDLVAARSIIQARNAQGLGLERLVNSLSTSSFVKQVMRTRIQKLSTQAKFKSRFKASTKKGGKLSIGLDIVTETSDKAKIKVDNKVKTGIKSAQSIIDSITCV